MQNISRQFRELFRPIFRLVPMAFGESFNIAAYLKYSAWLRKYFFKLACQFDYLGRLVGSVQFWLSCAVGCSRLCSPFPGFRQVTNISNTWDRPYYGDDGERTTWRNLYCAMLCLSITLASSTLKSRLYRVCLIEFTRNKNSLRQIFQADAMMLIC